MIDALTAKLCYFQNLIGVNRYNFFTLENEALYFVEFCETENEYFFRVS